MDTRTGFAWIGPTPTRCCANAPTHEALSEIVPSGVVGRIDGRKFVQIKTGPMSTIATPQIRDIFDHLNESALTYDQFAERSTDEARKARMSRIGADRADMARSLARSAARIGLELPPAGSVGGVMNTVWMGIRGSLAPNDEAATTGQCILADRRLAEHYSEALAEEDTPEALKALFEEQRGMIQADIRTLETALEGR